MLGLDSRAARVTWTVLLILLLCLLVYAIRHTLFIFIVALLFAYLLLPLVDFIDNHLPMERSRGPALAIVYLILVAGIVILGVQIGTTVTEQANTLAQRIADFLKPEQTQTLPLPQPVKPMGDRMISAVRAAIQDHYQQILQTLPQAALKAVSALGNLIFLVIIPILSFFFLKDGRKLQRYIMSQVRDDQTRAMLGEIAAELNLLLAQYMRAMVLLAFAASISYGLFFALIGVPYAVLLAAVAFPLEFIPMLGPLTASTIILLVAGFSGYHHLVYIVAFLAIYRIFQDYVLAPQLLSAGVELHPLLVIFGVFAGEQIAGIPGAFLSVPTMAVLRLVYRRLERSRIQQEIVAPEVVPIAK
jgi:predicted PurR-regulated permease PerM